MYKTLYLITVSSKKLANICPNSVQIDIPMKINSQLISLIFETTIITGWGSKHSFFTHTS